jgi:hypothetical protein
LFLIGRVRLQIFKPKTIYIYIYKLIRVIVNLSKRVVLDSVRYLANLIKTVTVKFYIYIYIFFFNIKLNKLIRVIVNLSKRVVGGTEIVVDNACEVFN